MILIETTAEILQPRGPKRPSNQVAYAHLLNRDGTKQPYPSRFLIALWDGEEPQPVGKITLAPQSIYVDKFGGLALAPKFQPPPGGRGGA